MSQELEQKVDTPSEESKEPQYTEVEQRAMEMGWRPQSEFNGDEANFVDAKEFIGRKPLFDKIDSQSRQIKAVTKALEEFKNHYSKVNENAYERALSSLKNQRKQALTDGDGDKFEQIDEQIKSVETQMEEVRAQRERPLVQEEPQVAPEFQNWVARNPWYNSVGYMRKFADDYGTRLATQGVAREEVLLKVAEAVRKEFPTKFTNPNKQSAPDVESSGSGSKKPAAKSGSFELTEQERKVMNDLVRTKVLTKDEYIADLKRLKGIA